MCVYVVNLIVVKCWFLHSVLRKEQYDDDVHCSAVYINDTNDAVYDNVEVCKVLFIHSLFTCTENKVILI